MAATKSDQALITALRRKLESVEEDRKNLCTAYHKTRSEYQIKDELRSSIYRLITRLEPKHRGKFKTKDWEDDD